MIIKPKIIVSGYSRIISLAKYAIENMVIPSGINIELADPTIVIRNIGLNHFNPGDILVCGEQTSFYLKEKFDFTTVPIEISGYELLQSLLEARNYSEGVTIVNYYRNIPIIEKSKGLLNMDIEQCVFTDYDDAKRLVGKLKNEGSKVIIGSSLACDLAEEYGIKCFFIYPQSAIKRALEYAIKIASLYYKESERAETLKALVDFAYSGIIGTDSETRVTIFNQVAENILNISKDMVIGSKLSDAFPEFCIVQKGNIPVPRVNELSGSGKKRVVFSSLPIQIDGHVHGQVTVLQDTATVKVLEEKIRRETYKKRFIAQNKFENISGSSKIILNTVANAKVYGKTDSPVLIIGETGTGKELFAQSMHNVSPRKSEPFVSINCGALTESLLDSELFGYESGAFTGARKDGKSGLFEMAHTGTIFLDEVGDISPSVQVRLLRVIQEKEIMRVGGDRLIPVDVKIISATNRDLWELVQQGKFREDLYYRLSVFELHLPPLRERKEDIPEIIQSLLRKKSPYMIKNIELFMKAFQSIKIYPWPGNVRELENVLERFIALVREYQPDLKAYKKVLNECLKRKIDKIKMPLPGERILKGNLSEIEAAELISILKDLDGNKSKAADTLGISRATLYRKLRDFGIT